MKFFGTKDIKVFVENVLKSKKDDLIEKIVIDIPAGSGYSSRLLKEIGVRVEPYDLFPDLFHVDGLMCKHADLSLDLPIESRSTDYILCQEGIEHLSDQLHLFREFNRVLKKGGVLFLTTPNHSKLRSKISYLLTESRYFYKAMPPNEIDSIWFSDHRFCDEIYFGHIFLIGIQKLRALAKISGFRIQKIHHLRVNHTSFFLFFFLYPFILIVNLLAYVRAMHKHQDVDKSTRKTVYREILKLGIDPRILVDGHLFVEFEKQFELSEIGPVLHSQHADLNFIT